MNDPKNIAAGILARGKAMHETSCAKGVICSCDRLGPYRCEAHGDANRRKEACAAINTMGVAELGAVHGGLREYIAQLEGERDTLTAELAFQRKRADDEQADKQRIGYALMDDVARLTAELAIATRQREEMAAALQAADDAFTGEGGRRLYTACTAFDAHKVIAAALANNKATT